MQRTEEHTVTITTSTILKTIGIVLLVWFLFLIREVIIIVFVAFVISSAITPMVDRLQQWRIPRIVSIVGIAVLFLGLVSLTVVLIIPPVITELGQLAVRLPEIYSSTVGFLLPAGTSADGFSILDTVQRNLESFSRGLVQLTTSLFGTISVVFGGVASFLTVLVVGFFMSMEEEGPRKLIQSLAPAQFQPYLVQLVKKIEHKMGSWLRGQLLLSLIIGVLTYIGLTILGVKYALVLAILAGFMEVIPFIGPVLAAIPAIFFAATESPALALFVLGLYVVIQQLENNLIVPKVMQQTVGLHPIVILIALLIGGRVGGIIGVILAVPLATIIAIFLTDIFSETRAVEEDVASQRKTL